MCLFHQFTVSECEFFIGEIAMCMETDQVPRQLIGFWPDKLETLLKILDHLSVTFTSRIVPSLSYRIFVFILFLRRAKSARFGTKQFGFLCAILWPAKKMYSIPLREVITPVSDSALPMDKISFGIRGDEHLRGSLSYVDAV